MRGSRAFALLRKFAGQPVAAAGAVLMLLIVCLALAVPVLPLPNPNVTELGNRLAAPGASGHLLGTDLLGRDILSRLVWGTRTSLAVALAATVVAAGVGSLIGLFAGYFGKRTDWVLMRGIDTLMAFPYLLLALAIVAILGPGLLNALIAIAVVNIPFFARTVRGATLGMVRRDFVDTARMNGRSHAGIIFGEIFPNVLPVIVITMSTTLGWMILETAGLSFLGLGAQPPQSDLGSMLGEGRLLLLINPHLALLPGVVVFLLVMAINLVGDGLRDVLDPRLAGGGAVTSPGAPTPVSALERDGTDRTNRTDGTDLVLDVRNLSVEFRVGDRMLRAVDDVSIAIRRGGSLGLVGESGSGKSVTALSLLRLLPGQSARIASGSVGFLGEDLLRVSRSRLRDVRGNRVAYVFQDPLTTLNPVIPVGRQIAESVLLHRDVARSEAWSEAVLWMDRLQIPQAADKARSYPHELSGGMRQRIGIAMAMVNQPDLIIADEPTTALDVTVQSVVLELLRELVRENETALLFISHDLALVSELCADLAVLYAGRIVERGPTAEVLGRPGHPYTRRLMECLPLVGDAGRQLRPIQGSPPGLADIPESCAFAPRCEWAQEVCRERAIPLDEDETRAVRCIRRQEICEEVSER